MSNLEDHQSVKVLIVDDEPAIRITYAKWLRENHGLTVESAASYDEATRAISDYRDQFDVVLVDEMLEEGKQSGLDLLDYLRQEYPDVAVIVCTGWGADRRDDAMARGAYRFVEKPFSHDSLAQSIHVAAGQNRNRRSLRLYEALDEVYKSIHSVSTLEQVWYLVCRAAVDIFGAEHSGVVVFNAQEDLGMVMADYPPSGALNKTVQVSGVPAEERLVREAKEFHYPDVADSANVADLGAVRTFLVELGVKEVVVIPVVVRGRVVASFSLDRLNRHRPFSPLDLDCARRLAIQLAIAWDNIEQTGAVRVDRDHIAQLHIAVAGLMAAESSSQVLSVAAREARKAFAADSVLVLQPDRAGTLQVAIADPSGLCACGVKPGGMSDDVMVTGEFKFLLEEDIFVGGQDNTSILRELNVRSAICLPIPTKPITSDKHMVSALIWILFYRPRMFTLTDRQALEVFAAQIAIAHSNAVERDRTRLAIAALNDVSNLTENADLSETVDEILEKATNTFGCSHTTLYVFLEKDDEDVDGRKHGSGSFVYAKGFGLPSGVKVQARDDGGNGWKLWEVLNAKVGPNYYYSANSQADELLGDDFARAALHTSSIALKLSSGNNRVGVLFCNYGDQHIFVQEEIDRMLLFASFAGIVLRNSLLYRNADRESRKVQFLNEVANEIGSASDLNTALSIVATKAIDMISSNSTGTNDLVARVRIKWDSDTILEATASSRTGGQWESDQPGEQPKDVLTSLGIEAGAFLSGNILRIGGRLDLLKAETGLSFGPNTQSIMVIPLRNGTGVEGVILLESSREKAFGRESERVLEALARQTVVALSNARHREEIDRRNRDLEDLHNLVKSRTVLVWAGILGATWGHAIKRDSVTIRDNVTLMKSKGPVPEQLREPLDRIEKLANRMLSQKLTPPLAVEEGVHLFLINDLLRTCIRRAEATADGQQVQISPMLEPTREVRVKASEEWFRNALEIVIDNAIQATLKTRNESVSVRTAVRDSVCLIEIEDTGPGIPGDVRDKIFREKVVKTGASRGQGIGLLLAQLIVQTYGGSIYIAETGPKGTKMTITMPIPL